MIFIDWKKMPLVPAIIQDQQSHQILMLGYMNEEALNETVKTGMVTFFSRSRQTIWVKGETSGNNLRVVEVLPDCDGDALLIKARPEGPTCHRQTTSCFTASLASTFLGELQATINARVSLKTGNSYVAKLVTEGVDRIIQKVGEEAIETVIAAKNSDKLKLESEAADLIFHLILLLQQKSSSFEAVIDILQERHRQRQASHQLSEQ